MIDSLFVPEFELQPKVLRKAFACNQLILHEVGHGGLSIVQLQEALGHTSLDTTKIYLADVDRYLRKLIQPVGTAQAASIIIALRDANSSKMGGH